MLENDGAALSSVLETRQRKHGQKLFPESEHAHKQVEILYCGKRTGVDGVCYGGTVRAWRGMKVSLEYASTSLIST